MGSGRAGDSEVDAAAAGVQGLAVSDGASQQPAAANNENDWGKVVEQKKPYYEKRVNMFAAIKAKHEAELEAAKAANIPIKVTLPDGSEKPGIKNVTNPMDIANSISKSLAKKTIVAKVDGKVWDLLRPLEGDCSLELCSFEDPDGKEVRL
jgi:threonyl-tRNA synthetase